MLGIEIIYVGWIHPVTLDTCKAIKMQLSGTDSCKTINDGVGVGVLVAAHSISNWSIFSTLTLHF